MKLRLCHMVANEQKQKYEVCRLKKEIRKATEIKCFYTRQDKYGSDLIITNDSSIGHLSAGMGKEVWLLLKKTPFWYWGLKGEQTFWYPSMRLFRQEKSNNWNELMIRVSNYLAAKLKTNSL